VTVVQYLEAAVPYGYLLDEHLEAYFWFIVGLRHDYPSDIAELVLDDLFETYNHFKWSRLDVDRYRAWQSVRLCLYWFSQLGGSTYGLS
jgi:hypothetical protein